MMTRVTYSTLRFCLCFNEFTMKAVSGTKNPLSAAVSSSTPLCVIHLCTYICLCNREKDRNSGTIVGNTSHGSWLFILRTRGRPLLNSGTSRKLPRSLLTSPVARKSSLREPWTSKGLFVVQQGLSDRLILYTSW